MSENKETKDWNKLATDNAIAEGINAMNLGVAQSKREQKIARKYAKWQREQLLSREGVERFAEELVFNITAGGYETPSDQDRDMAKRILESVLGE